MTLTRWQQCWIGWQQQLQHGECTVLTWLSLLLLQRLECCGCCAFTLVAYATPDVLVCIGLLVCHKLCLKNQSVSYVGFLRSMHALLRYYNEIGKSSTSCTTTCRASCLCHTLLESVKKEVEAV